MPHSHRLASASALPLLPLSIGAPKTKKPNLEDVALEVPTHFSDIPLDVLPLVLHAVHSENGYESLQNACQTNTSLAEICQDQAFWSEVLQYSNWSVAWPTRAQPGGMQPKAFYAMMCQMSIKHRDALVTLGTKKEIAARTFQDCKALEITVLPDDITTIRTRAFHNCPKLALTALPSGLTTIGSLAFSGCKKLALTELPSGLTTIEDFAFENCTSLALTALPSGLTAIESYAFANCTSLALTSLPESVTYVGYYAFFGCIALQNAQPFERQVSTLNPYAF